MNLWHLNIYCRINKLKRKSETIIDLELIKINLNILVQINNLT